MFHATVSRYARDRDGREHRFERSFSNAEEYRSFLRSNPEYGPDRFLPSFGSFFGWRDPFDVFETQLLPNSTQADSRYLPEGISVDEYEEEARKLDAETEERTARKSALQSYKERLGSYLERFRNAKKNDLVERLEKDIAAIDKELAAIAE